MEPIRGKSEIKDVFHRYKMNKLNIRKERTKTSILNLQEIASDLKIPDPSLIVTYIKNRLAIAINFKDNRAIITRDVDTDKIRDSLYEFIENFVLCKKCKQPELSYSLEKKKLCTNCKSCGITGKIESNQYTEKVIKEFELILSKTNSNKKLKKTKEVKEVKEVKEKGQKISDETIIGSDNSD
jgi:translation initiation factor 5